jgi:hypothetical protein
VTVAGVALTAADFNIEYAGQPGWAGVADRGTQVAVSTTVTEALKLEGLARDVVRQVQNARKDAKLDLLDKIELHLSAESPELAKAIAEHRQTIATAVQATAWSAEPLSGRRVTPRPPRSTATARHRAAEGVGRGVHAFVVQASRLHPPQRRDACTHDVRVTSSRLPARRRSGRASPSPSRRPAPPRSPSPRSVRPARVTSAVSS